MYRTKCRRSLKSVTNIYKHNKLAQNLVSKVDLRPYKCPGFASLLKINGFHEIRILIVMFTVLGVVGKRSGVSVRPSRAMDGRVLQDSVPHQWEAQKLPRGGSQYRELLQEQDLRMVRQRPGVRCISELPKQSSENFLVHLYSSLSRNHHASGNQMYCGNSPE